MAQKGYASAPFHNEQMTKTQTNIVVDDNSIQLRAYHIHHEKGGSALDNWLEAERDLGAVSRLVNEGGPDKY